MADSLKTVQGAVLRERCHISARREFSQWFTADWGLLAEGENKINPVHVRNAWQTNSKAMRKLSVKVCRHQLAEGDLRSGICWCSLACIQVTYAFHQAQEEIHLGRAGGWGCREDGQGLACLWPFQ